MDGPSYLLTLFKSKNHYLSLSATNKKKLLTSIDESWQVVLSLWKYAEMRATSIHFLSKSFVTMKAGGG